MGDMNELDELRSHYKFIADLGMTESEYFHEVVLPVLNARRDGWVEDPDNPDGTLFGSHHYDD